MTQNLVMSDNVRCFSKTGYRHLIRAFLDRGYSAKTFDDPALSLNSAHLVVRHDVDMSLELARDIAEVEQQLGIKSVYFVRVSGPFYNPHTQDNRAHLAALVHMGHQVGLHFDLAVYQSDAANLQSDELHRFVQNEAYVLESLIDKKINMLSFHRPVSELLGYAGRIGGLIHTYEPRFFHDMAYISDSAGRWRYGHPLDHEAVAQRRAVQLLTHPIWWALGNKGDDAVAALDRFVARQELEFRNSLAENCKPYRARVNNQRMVV